MINERVQVVLDATADLVARFDAAGRRIYLVGGSVRDLFFGGARPGDTPESETDIDLTTDAGPDEVERLLSGWASAVWLQGKRFGTIGAMKGGRRFEVTTHRAESYEPSSRHPEVRFGTEIADDLARRDFTVNAMALRLPTLELVDPYGGLEDLAASRLRTPLDAEATFSDDPVRMLRAARLVAGYGLAPVPEIPATIRVMAERLRIVSAERIRDELDKLMVLPAPGAGLWFLVETGLAAEFIPELPALALEQDPIHRHKDVLAHTIAVVDKTSADKVLRLAALFHDFGKPKTRSLGPGGVSFHHHDVVGARMARVRMTALRYPKDEIDAVEKLVELHLRFHTYRMGWTDSALRRYARDAGDLLDRLNELTRCDCTTRNVAKARALELRMDELEARLADLRAREELESIRPELDGLQVMAQLGIGPGRDVGRALAHLLEIRLEEGPLGEEEARRRLAAWWAAEAENP